ncbi:YraN family protein [Vibrio sp. S4M6]|uniref:YraN family protein n=1 Tax=Vibrio sinus TaxID=2946865 RepID=UPI002029D678|nr:YraN family protein [Vibrio sinus]MCL9781482.1 YraN family protein [Vibrio sinus]
MGLINRKNIGSKYEATAQKYLVQHGLHFIEKNFSVKCGEIDLIMREGDIIVFVEVKYRKTQQFGHAAESVTRNKMRKLVNSANLWLNKHNLSPHSTDFRFDVVAIHQNGDHIEWIKNAITEG